VNPLDLFSEQGDYFWCVVQSRVGEVDVSIDRTELNNGALDLLQRLITNLDSTLDSSIHFFDTVKSRYAIEYIDDLKAPRAVVSRSGFCIFWSSSVGDRRGDATAGVDFNTRFEPIDLSIGD
tara:strand:+ start:1435 stop:1800 length:366 start_codon:yes stop_codon:yes gene_type:complete